MSKPKPANSSEIKPKTVQRLGIIILDITTSELTSELWGEFFEIVLPAKIEDHSKVSLSHCILVTLHFHYWAIGQLKLTHFKSAYQRRKKFSGSTHYVNG